MSIGSQVTVRHFSGVVSRIVNKGDLYKERPNDAHFKPYAGESFAVVVDDKGRSHWAAAWEIGL